MNKIQAACLVFMSFCLLLSSFLFPNSVNAQDNPLGLSENEKIWIKEHPVVRIGVDGKYAPYSYQNSELQYEGIALDFIREIESSTGLTFEIAPGLAWTEIVEGARSKALDVIATAFKTPDRDQFLNFSQIYINTPLIIMTQTGNEDVRNPTDLIQKRVALVKGYLSTERVLKDFPAIVPHFVETPLEGLQALAIGEVDAYVGVLGVSTYVARENGLSNLTVASQYDLNVDGQRFAVRDDWPELVGILDKALNHMTVRERNSLISKWVPVMDQTLQTSGSAPPFELSPEEKKWLEENNKLRIGAMNSWPPMDYVDSNGEPKGVGVDFISLFNRRLNGPFEIVQDDWPTLLKKLEKGELDALMDITPTAERRLQFDFTSPYFEVPHVIIARKKGPNYRDLAALSGKTVALEEGFFIEKEIREAYPSISIKKYPTTSDALDATVKGEVDAYIGNRAVAFYIIRNELIDSLRQHGKLQGTSSVNAIAVRKDIPVLREILQKVLDSVSTAEFRAITQDWVADQGGKLQLSSEERAWLKEHPLIRVAADPYYPPIEYIDDYENFSGIAIDYLNELEAILGVTFDTSSRQDWNSSVEKVRNRELDIFSAAAETEDRKEIAIFTDPYIKLPQFIFALDTQPYIDGMAGLKGKTVAAVKGYAVTDHLMSGNWGINLELVSDVSEGLNLLQNRKVDAYIGSILVTSEALKQNGYTNIRVVGNTPFNHGLAIGVRKDWPELAAILQKALNTISEETRQQILQKWVSLKLVEETDYSLVWKIVVGSLGILVIFFGWNAYLQRGLERQKKNYLSLQEQLRQAQKMDAVGQLTGGIAHDFNNILGIILGNLELAYERLERIKDQQTLININAALEGAKRGADITRQLLNFSRKDTDGKKLINVNKTLKETEGLLGKSLTVAIDIKFTLASDIWDVNVNPGEFQDAIINLSINARDAMPDGGTLEFKTCNKTLVEEYVKRTPQAKVGDYVMVSVSDTGEGMSTGIQDRIFEPFFTTKAVGKGTGLGLSMVYGFVKRSQGFIDIHSEIDKGTRFEIYFPRAKQIDTPGASLESQQKTLPQGTERILVVDDEEQLVKIAATYLQDLGYQVETALDAEQALQLLQVKPEFHLLFSDVVMPGGNDGFELAGKARELFPDIKVLLTSGFIKESESSIARASIASQNLLSKPYSKLELAVAIRRVLDTPDVDNQESA